LAHGLAPVRETAARAIRLNRARNAGFAAPFVEASVRIGNFVL
jgi:hypothetical protein